MPCPVLMSTSDGTRTRVPAAPRVLGGVGALVVVRTASRCRRPWHLRVIAPVGARPPVRRRRPHDPHAGAELAWPAPPRRAPRRAARGHHPAAAQEDQAVGELAGQGQVVHGAQHGQPALASQLVDELERVDSPTEVQRAGGLVEEEHGRLLGQGPGQDEPLQLPADRVPSGAVRHGAAGRGARAARRTPAVAPPSRRRSSRCAASGPAGRSRPPSSRRGARAAGARRRPAGPAACGDRAPTTPCRRPRSRPRRPPGGPSPAASWSSPPRWDR